MAQGPPGWAFATHSVTRPRLLEAGPSHRKEAPMDDLTQLIFEQRGHVAILTLNAPPVNALTRTLMTS